MNIDKQFETFDGRMPTYGFAHAKVKKPILSPILLDFIGNMDIILEDFQRLFYSTI